MRRIAVVLWLALAGCVLSQPSARAQAPESDSLRRAPPSVAASVDSAVLRIDDVLRRVFDRNPSIAAARAASEEARAREGRAGSFEDPMLDLMAAPGSYGNSPVEPAYRVALTQPFPLFGQRGLRADVAGAEGRAAAFDVRTMQLDLLHEARIAYYEYWRIMRAADLTRELQRLMGEFRRVALAKYSAGQVGQQDPLQADAEIAMLDHQIVVLERERRVTIARLNVLMHDPPDEERPPPPREIALPDTSLDHRDQIERARAHRPELRVVNAEVEASEANVALSDRERWPMTTLGVVYDRFWTESELRTSVTLGLSLPIFAGRRSAARAEARARLAGSIARRDAAADRVALEVSTAVARVHETAHDLSVSRGRLVPLAERTVRATRASYEADRTDFLALLNSVRDLLRARLQADAAFTTLQLARTELDRAVGEMPSFLEEEQP